MVITPPPPSPKTLSEIQIILFFHPSYTCLNEYFNKVKFHPLVVVKISISAFLVQFLSEKSNCFWNQVLTVVRYFRAWKCNFPLLNVTKTDRKTDGPTNQPTDGQKGYHWEVTLPRNESMN